MSSVVALYYSVIAQPDGCRQECRAALRVQQSRGEGEAEGAAQALYSVVQQLVSMMEVSLVNINMYILSFLSLF